MRGCLTDLMTHWRKIFLNYDLCNFIFPFFVKGFVKGFVSCPTSPDFNAECVFLNRKQYRRERIKRRVYGVDGRVMIEYMEKRGLETGVLVDGIGSV